MGGRVTGKADIWSDSENSKSTSDLAGFQGLLASLAISSGKASPLEESCCLCTPIYSWHGQGGFLFSFQELQSQPNRNKMEL